MGVKIILKKICTTFMLFSLWLMPQSIVIADDAPKGFFAPNYAKSGGLEDNSYPVFRYESPSHSGKATRKSLDPKTAPKDMFSERAIKPYLETSSTDTGIKIIGIGLVVDATDPYHYQENFYKLLNTSIKYGIDITFVYPLGVKFPYLPVRSREDYTRFGLMGGGMRPEKEMPFKDIEFSPTWIIRTNKGNILLEGIDNIENKITSRKTLVPSLASQIPPTSLATPTS